MAGPLPSLALEMSMDGIALHQLAFDGHWHELARVPLADAALREKMANMRDIAQRLEGRNFKVRVWLPADQIVRKTCEITATEARARDQQARRVLEKITPHSGADFAVSVNTPGDEQETWVVGARHKTMLEAFAFAKSHGFKAVVYSTREPLEGFVDKPYFTLPPNRKKTIALGILAAAVVGSVIAGATAFRISDPYLWWERPPEAADFAPFQGADLALDSSADNVLPAGTAIPDFYEIAGISTASNSNILPYIPPRRLTAEALEEITAPPPLQPDPFDASFSMMVEPVRFSLPKEFAGFADPSAADGPPSLGLYNVFTEVIPIQEPVEFDLTQTATLPSALSSVVVYPAPLTFANTRLLLSPLPSRAVTMPYELQLELQQEFGIGIEDIPEPDATVLADTRVVEVIRGLPDILPKLRSGQEIPPQVAVQQVQPTVTIVETIPADAETIATAARGFRLIEGRPEIEPIRRVVPPAVEDPPIEEPPVVQVTEVENPLTEEPTTEDPPIVPVAEVETAPVDTPLATETETIVANNVPAEDPADFSGEIEIISGLPDLPPVLRSGDPIPEPGSLVEPEETVETVQALDISPVELRTATANDLMIEVAALDPAIAAANALRAKRRPQAIIEMIEPVDPMLSDAAPAVAELASHRGQGFDANAARIAELASNRPRAVAPAVPADPPQTVTLPTTASVARAATIEDGINLRKTSLIGIFGTADSRDVLIRLSTGRIVQVSLGESFSGWRVVAIGEDSIRIQKGSRTEILRMPD